jgi:hypothetical protein
VKLHYDGMNTTFTPENEDDQKLLVGFTNLDAVTNRLSGLSQDRLFQFNRDRTVDISDCIDFLQNVIAEDSLYDYDDPPEDDDDDIPTPVPGSKL